MQECHPGIGLSTTGDAEVGRARAAGAAVGGADKADPFELSLIGRGENRLAKPALHPLRMIQTLTDSQKEALHRSIRQVLNQGIRLGGLIYERDLYGRHGKYGPEYYLVAYKTDEPCPLCKTSIVKIRTGSTASYICPACQMLE